MERVAGNGQNNQWKDDPPYDGGNGKHCSDRITCYGTIRLNRQTRTPNAATPKCAFRHSLRL
jgi:hypothetical protein